MRNSKVWYIFYEPQVASSPPKTVVGPFRTCIVLLFLCKTHGICSKPTGYVVCCTLGTGFFGYVWRLLGVNLQFSDTPKYHMVGNICHNLRYITGNQNLPLSYWCSYHIPCYPHMFVLIFFSWVHRQPTSKSPSNSRGKRSWDNDWKGNSWAARQHEVWKRGTTSPPLISGSINPSIP